MKRLSLLMFGLTCAGACSQAPAAEHYGNLVTYMRLNKMVPPSSQQ